jgi:hypothetical protein
MFSDFPTALTRASSSSRIGPSRSPGGQRCARPESLWPAVSRSSCTRCCETGPSSCQLRPSNPRDRRPNPAPRGATPTGGSRRRRGFCCRGQPLADCDFNLAALHPAYPIKCRTSTQRTQAPESVDIWKRFPLDPLENTIDVKPPNRSASKARIPCGMYGPPSRLLNWVAKGSARSARAITNRTSSPPRPDRRTPLKRRKRVRCGIGA